MTTFSKLAKKAVFLLFISAMFLLSCRYLKTPVGRVNQVNIDIVNYHLPTISNLYKLYFIVYESKELTKSWTYVYKSDDAEDKVRLRKIHAIEYPEIKKSLDELKIHWTNKEQAAYEEICLKIETLYEKEKSVMDKLNSYESYEDVMVVFQVDSEFERGEDSITSDTEEILKALNELIIMREDKLKEIIKQSDTQTRVNQKTDK